MKTKNILRPAMLVSSLLVTIYGQAQVSVDNNFPPSGSYVGCDASITDELEIRHNGNRRIEWYTDALHRMSLYPNVINPNLNGYSVNQTGYFGLSDQPAFFNGSGPFSKIHLVEAMGSTNPVNYAQELGYRDWMRNGITMTGNSDQSYMGAKYNGDDISDLVLQWSDNPEDAIYGTDRLRFLFTNRRSTTGDLYGARSEEGLESFRVFVEDDFNANVGIGDFYRESVLTASVVDPTERLDILDGRVRVRDLPTDPLSVSDEMVTVNMLSGILEHRPIPISTGGATDCDWTLVGAAGSNSNIATAYAGNPGCPQADKKVGIGTNIPQAKLHVRHSEADGGLAACLTVDFFADAVSIAEGLRVNVSPVTTSAPSVNVRGIFSNVSNVGDLSVAGTADGFGLLARVTQSAPLFARDLGGAYGDVIITNGTTTNAFGSRGNALINGGTVTNGYGVLATSVAGVTAQVTNNYGLYAESRGSVGLITNSRGVYARGTDGTALNYAYQGWANGGDNTVNYGAHLVATGGTGSTNYGVYAYVPPGAPHWAAYLVGRSFTTGNFWTPSDEALKSNIEAITDGTERILQLQPKTYTFNVSGYPSMNLPSDQHYGFKAQDLELVFPEMVTDAIHPAVIDSLGNEIYPAIPFKAVSTTELTPYLVAAFQEQHQQLAEAQATNDALNDQLQQLNDRLDAMEQNVANCCSAQGAIQNGGVEIDEKSFNSNDRYLRIAPNPFETQTTIFYQLEQGGRMQLVANSTDGKQLQVLQEANLEQGNYQYEWATGDLAPGVYYVTLLVDAKPITKRVVKILR